MMPNDLKDPFDELLFQVRVSRRYHSKRRGLLEAGHRLASAFAVIAGSGAAASLMGGGTGLLFPILAFLSAILSGASLAFGWNATATKHADLWRRFTNLEKEMIGCKRIDQIRINEFEQQKLTIEADEPPSLRVVMADAYNEQFLAEELPERFEIPWHRGLLGSVLDIKPREIDRPDAQKVGRDTPSSHTLDRSEQKTPDFTNDPYGD